jgi:two-component system CheB/CheR fusion protein
VVENVYFLDREVLVDRNKGIDVTGISLAEGLDEMLSAAIELLGADMGNLQLLDAERKVLLIAAHQGFTQDFLDFFREVSAEEDSACGRALRTGTPVVIEDVELDVQFAPFHSVARAAGCRAVVSAPLIGHQGEVLGMLSAHFRSPHRLSDEDMHRLHFYLRRAADFIERHRFEEALQKAKAAADQANQAKSRFLAAASHDLRQPLQTFGLLYGLLAKRMPDPEAQRILAKLDDTVADMATLLDTLLDINQIEGGAIKPELAVFPVSALLKRLRDEFAPLAASKLLKLHIVPSSIAIGSDRRLLQRMLSNLLSNAIKYTDRGKIVVGCRRRGDTLRIEVWDTGIGIPAQNIDRVFDEFYRVDRTDSTRFGLGLGLYIVRRFAELLGHKVEVRSTAGKGTMFALTVPIANSAPAAGGRGDKQNASAPSILLIEDDSTQLHALRELLELEGYVVVATRTGEEALSQLGGPAPIRPDVVIADYNLPGALTGVKVVDLVRTELGAQVPALIVSGDKSLATLRAFEASGHAIITKPVRAADLLAAVDALVKTAKPEWRGINKLQTAMPSASSAAVEADIAVIEDEPGVRDAFRMMLEEAGHRVATYASGEAFLGDPGHSRFRCLVVDLTLPGIDGLELQSRLKSERAGAPIIFVTGSGELPTAVKAMREGAADFLQKPVRRAELSESVKRALKKGGQGAADRAEHENVARRISTLTGRERQVMEQMLAGKATKNIAAELGISQRTTEHHRQAVMRKIGAKSLAMLVRMVLPHLPGG